MLSRNYGFVVELRLHKPGDYGLIKFEVSYEEKCKSAFCDVLCMAACSFLPYSVKFAKMIHCNFMCVVPFTNQITLICVKVK